MQRAFDSILAGLLDKVAAGRSMPFSGKPLVLLAVSGGIDSMCMAELFRRSALDIRFAVAHCNFSLRGEDSDSDEALVTGWAKTAGVRLHKTRFDTRKYAEEKGLSIEMAARELRYSWFADICSEFGYVAVAVAHNANDNVETLFLNLLRGTGMKGISGMKQISSMPVSGSSKPGLSDNQSAVLTRPLLSFTRKRIEGFVRANNISYHDDRTNFESEYRRNRIRNLVFPVLEQINPSFISTVTREMSYFSQAGMIADDYFKSRSGYESDGRIDIRRLMAEPYWEYLLYRTMEKYGFSSAVVSSVKHLLESGRTVSGKVFTAERYVMVTTGTELIVKEREGNRRQERRFPVLKRRGTLPPVLSDIPGTDTDIVTVHGPGLYNFNGVPFSVEEVGRKSLASLKAPSGTLYFDSRKLPYPFLCRRWEAGDWMVPIGMKGKKKLSDLFTDLKYSLLDKSRAVILVSGNEQEGIAEGQGRHVSAVLGVRADDATKVSEDTETVMVIKIRHEDGTV